MVVEGHTIMVKNPLDQKALGYFSSVLLTLNFKQLQTTIFVFSILNIMKDHGNYPRDKCPTGKCPEGKYPTFVMGTVALFLSLFTTYTKTYQQLTNLFKQNWGAHWAQSTLKSLILWNYTIPLFYYIRLCIFPYKPFHTSNISEISDVSDIFRIFRIFSRIFG